jgi:restriction system protein
MELPKFHETFLPILEILDEEGALSSRELIAKVKRKYYDSLPTELKQEKTRSGKNILIDRIQWGKSYLKLAKYLSYPKRGFVELSPKGKAQLKTGVMTLDILKSDKDWIAHSEAVLSKKNNASFKQIEIDNSSPQDLIDSGFSAIETEVKTELLERLKEIDPYYFEKVILILLKKMGYGDFIETSKSNDQGIDGIINEDKLGLEKIYTQAKRYSDNKVREKDIRNFIGAMSGDTRKGVFITTSSFDQGAINKAKEAHHTIILIDGVQLSELMLQYNVGVQVKTTYEVKELDHDFFEED